MKALDSLFTLKLNLSTEQERVVMLTEEGTQRQRMEVQAKAQANSSAARVAEMVIASEGTCIHMSIRYLLVLVFSCLVLLMQPLARPIHNQLTQSISLHTRINILAYI